MTRVTKMGRKTYEEATPYSRPEAIPIDSTRKARAPLPPQNQVEQQLGLNKGRSEARRQRREKDRNAGKVCFNCREEGHRINDCPQATKTGKKSGPICYRCGKSDHSLKQCRLHPSKGMPFAECFVCKERGHITGNCPKNGNGIYPDGGSCKICKSIEHFAKDCPVPGEVREGHMIGEITGREGADEDDFHSVLKVEKSMRKASLPKPTVKKVIKF